MSIGTTHRYEVVSHLRKTTAHPLDHAHASVREVMSEGQSGQGDAWPTRKPLDRKVMGVVVRSLIW